MNDLLNKAHKTFSAIPGPAIILLSVVLASPVQAQGELPFDIEPVNTFDEPWALAFLPDGRMLVTEKKGSMHVLTADGRESEPVRWVPDVDYGGQGGLGDIALHPDFEDNNLIYFSYVETGVGDTRGAAVARAVLSFDASDRGDLAERVALPDYPAVVERIVLFHVVAFDWNCPQHITPRFTLDEWRELGGAEPTT